MGPYFVLRNKFLSHMQYCLDNRRMDALDIMLLAPSAVPMNNPLTSFRMGSTSKYSFSIVSSV